MARYSPILRWKRGEKVALTNLTPLGKVDVWPLVMLGPDQFNPKPATTTKPARSAAEAFIEEMLASWGSTAFFLDASALHSAPHTPHPILAIAAAARVAGVQLIPPSSLGAPNLYRAAIATIAGIDGRGAGLRVDLQELTSASAWVGGMLIAPADTHLIADFSTNVANVAALGAVIIQAFNNLHLGSTWRSVTVAGCSLPENFTGYPAGVHQIHRAEWSLWQSLAAGGLNYQLNYGDYATVPPGAPPPGIAWGFPINVKYTLDTDFLVCRGVKTTGPAAVDMSVQLIGHSHRIIGLPARNPLVHCWGDSRIDRIGALAESPGNLEKWVQISVNRHIEKVRSDLP